MAMGHEKGGIKGSKKGIKHSFAGRHLHETEHHGRMKHEVGTHSAFPSHEGSGPTNLNDKSFDTHGDGMSEKNVY